MKTATLSRRVTTTIPPISWKSPTVGYYQHSPTVGEQFLFYFEDKKGEVQFIHTGTVTAKLLKLGVCVFHTKRSVYVLELGPDDKAP